MNSSSTVSAELGLRLVVPQQTIVPLVASLYYSKEDPYAIRIAFHVGLDEPVEWIFARELLSSGTEGREGLGDVVVWPSASAADGTPGAGLLPVYLPEALAGALPRVERLRVRMLAFVHPAMDQDEVCAVALRAVVESELAKSMTLRVRREIMNIRVADWRAG